MPRFVDKTGERFGKLTVVSLYSRASRNPLKQIKWLCKCDCGNVVVVQSGNLATGNTKSCGCLTEGKQGMFKPNPNRLYNSWRAMKARCNNPNNNRYYLYGGRGIKVCKEWELFSNFKSWALCNGYSEELSIDRIDNDKGYSPENCRWILPQEQSRNRRCVKND